MTCGEAAAPLTGDARAKGVPQVEFLVEKVRLERFWTADLPRSYIRCLEDRAKPVSASLEVIRRLSVDPLTIGGSHSPFLSRPRELAALLVHATATKPAGPLRPSP